MTETGKQLGWQGWSAAIITVFLSVTPRFFHLNIPFDRDEGAYAYIADVIQRGGLPYLSAFDHKPPLVYYFYYLAFNVFGHSITAPRILAILFVATACLLLLLFVYRLTKNLPAAAFSSFILGFASASPAYLGFSANTELFTLPFLIGGTILLARKDPAPQRFFLAGMVFGIGFLVKQPVAVVAGSVFMFHGIRLLRMPAYLLKIASFFGAGVSLPLGIVALCFYLSGMFSTFWDACFTYNFGYMGQLTFAESLSLLLRTVNAIAHFDPVTWVAGIAGIFMLLKFEVSSYRKGYVLTVLIGSALATAMGKYFYPHYFIFVLPVLAATAGSGAAILMTRKPGRSVLAGISVLVCLSCVLSARFLPVPDSDIIKLAYGTATNNQAKSMGDFLRSNALAGGSVFIVGSEPEVLFYSGLKSSSRMFYFFPLVAQTRMLQELRRETVAELILRPPDYVLIVNVPDSLGLRAVDDDAFVQKLFEIFTEYRLLGIIADGSEKVLTGDAQKMRSIAGKGAAMILLRSPTDSAANGITFGELLGKKVRED